MELFDRRGKPIHAGDKVLWARRVMVVVEFGDVFGQPGIKLDSGHGITGAFPDEVCVLPPDTPLPKSGNNWTNLKRRIAQGSNEFDPDLPDRRVGRRSQ